MLWIYDSQTVLKTFFFLALLNFLCIMHSISYLPLLKIGELTPCVWLSVRWFDSLTQGCKSAILNSRKSTQSRCCGNDSPDTEGRRDHGVCARVGSAPSDSEWWRTAKISGTEWLQAKANLHVRSWRWYACQVVILFAKSQWPVPIGLGPDFICLSLKVSVSASVSQKFLMLSRLARAISFLVRWLTHWKDGLIISTVLGTP